MNNQEQDNSDQGESLVSQLQLPPVYDSISSHNQPQEVSIVAPIFQIDTIII